MPSRRKIDRIVLWWPTHDPPPAPLVSLPVESTAQVPQARPRIRRCLDQREDRPLFYQVFGQPRRVSRVGSPAEGAAVQPRPAAAGGVRSSPGQADFQGRHPPGIDRPRPALWAVPARSLEGQSRHWT